MDLTQLANLGEFIGGVAVVSSLVYVGLRARENRAAIHASSAQSHADSVNGVDSITAGRVELTRLWRLSTEDPDSLTEDERACADSILLAAFNSFDSALLQGELGFLDRQTHEMIPQRVRAMFALNFVRGWWGRNPFAFTGALARFVEVECGVGRGGFRA